MIMMKMVGHPRRGASSSSATSNTSFPFTVVVGILLLLLVTMPTKSTATFNNNKRNIDTTATAEAAAGGNFNNNRNLLLSEKIVCANRRRRRRMMEEQDHQEERAMIEQEEQEQREQEELICTEVDTAKSDDNDDQDDDDGTDKLYKVIIGYYENESDNDELGTIQSILQNLLVSNYRQGDGLKAIHAAAAQVTLEQMQLLESDPNIEYVEQDYTVKPLSDEKSGGSENNNADDTNAGNSESGEVIPYGVDLIHARSDILPKPIPLSQSSPCNDPLSFKLGILDSGTDASHPDIPCLPLDDPNTNCMGKSFTSSRNEPWYRPDTSHGTHVHGTIGALGNNSMGVRGVLHDYGVCYIIARVFGRAGSFEDTSALLDSIEWMVNAGAQVINMSLGGSGYSIAADRAYKRWQSSNNILFVVAAGNDGAAGISTTMYPAAYDGVLSVAAVDFQGQHAKFSSFNDQVDIAAPGAAVLSTVPKALGSVATMFSEGVEDGVTGSIMAESPQPPEGVVTGELVECPNLGKEKCPGPGGHICLIERGEVLFQVKAENCEASGAAGLIVYNNVDGMFAGTLTAGNTIKIPVAGTSKEDGLKLVERTGKGMKLSSQEGYSFSDGTSMACPHVAGGAALLWRSCLDCRNTQIAQCLLKTAVDEGERGRDSKYGYGLMQLDKAYVCLTETIGCCDPQSTAQQPISVATEEDSTTTSEGDDAPLGTLLGDKVGSVTVDTDNDDLSASIAPDAPPTLPILEPDGPNSDSPGLGVTLSLEEGEGEEASASQETIEQEQEDLATDGKGTVRGISGGGGGGGGGSGPKKVVSSSDSSSVEVTSAASDLMRSITWTAAISTLGSGFLLLAGVLK